MEGRHFYHICLRGNNHQDLFYTDNDLIQVINRLAIAANEKDTEIIAICFLHNHFHLVINTKNKGSFMHHFRMSLTAYFNREHNCIGNVGTRKHFARLILHPCIDGGEDLMNAVSYVLRNPLWHGLSKNFMQYRWSSIFVYFNPPIEIHKIDEKDITFFLPFCKDLPDNWEMDISGLITLHSFIKKSVIEDLFKDYNNFIRFINVPSSIELKAIEKKGKKLRSINDNFSNFVKVTDIKISEQIITIARNEYNKTIPTLTSSEKIKIVLKIKKIIPQAKIKQLARILFIPESTLRRKIARLPNM